ncbi:MAG: hypothetical protein JWN04_1426 [Myxococcaceae bacterium]|nr:hypothetical protein [Myxococcaceae bacterium]
MSRVCARALVLGLAWALLPCSGAVAQKSFDLDDFVRPSTPGKEPAVQIGVPEPASKTAEPAAASPTESPAEARRSKRATEQQARAAQRAEVAQERAAAAEERAAQRAAAARARADERAAAASAPARVATRKEHARAEKPVRVRKKTAYDLLSESWHEPAPPELAAEHAKAALPDLVFHIQKTGAVYVLKPATRQGGFDETQLAIAKEAFNSWGPTPHARVLDLVYAATLHFNAPYVTLISGIRKDRGGSRHSHGLAADVVLPGVEDETLAAFFRAQGFCGVGTYPRSHFVHVDTRDQSYFWIDSSKPNQRGRVVQVRKDESTAADDAARARGSDGFVNPPRLQKALNVRMSRKRKAHQAKLERAAAKAAAQPTSSEPLPSSVTSER